MAVPTLVAILVFFAATRYLDDAGTRTKNTLAQLFAECGDRPDPFSIKNADGHNRLTAATEVWLDCNRKVNKRRGYVEPKNYDELHEIKDYAINSALLLMSIISISLIGRWVRRGMPDT